MTFYLRALTHLQLMAYFLCLFLFSCPHIAKPMQNNLRNIKGFTWILRNVELTSAGVMYCKTTWLHDLMADWTWGGTHATLTWPWDNTSIISCKCKRITLVFQFLLECLINYFYVVWKFMLFGLKLVHSEILGWFKNGIGQYGIQISLSQEHRNFYMKSAPSV